MKPTLNLCRSRWLLAAMLGLLAAITAPGQDAVWAQGATSLPTDLFVSAAPPNALDVGEARKTAEEGKPVVVRGKIGGLASPFADKYAMFLLADSQLTLPACGTQTPWDYCCEPREKVMANLATIQVVDAAGKLLKAPLRGVSGLNPMADVVVLGTVVKRDTNILIVNAKNIYVAKAAK
ncbi:MAG: hypothetical protein HY914_02925 [Desulfomonile tiedjei]|nr:hypothetical protein [Desulfomonile tiedjei]